MTAIEGTETIVKIIVVKAVMMIEVENMATAIDNILR
jgi:hypothetical protein